MSEDTMQDSEWQADAVQDPKQQTDTVHDLKEQAIAALKTVYDPEIPVNIYDLGLIYELDIDAQGQADVLMTLTAPGCPVADSMPGWVQEAVEGVPGIKSAHVEMAWEPPWTPDKMSLKAKLELNML